MMVIHTCMFTILRDRHGKGCATKELLSTSSSDSSVINEYNNDSYLSILVCVTTVDLFSKVSM